MARYLRYVLLVLEATSLPLLLTTLLLIITGYAIMYPHAYSALTLGALNYANAQRIHTDPVIRLSFTTLALIHGLTGTIILIEKYMKHRLIKELIKSVVIIALLMLLALTVAIDFSRILR
ncbi:MAG: hypothetical protein N3E36_05315 [Sulfolobales archaeon]|nr:hypothetical protein [Sulfolobales archaeon]MCX8199428.1 hypothetical protein [Sulfolobales archaeon]MDW8170257.1 hypothetical protein [Desulfurococcaceae archaeon]